MKELLSFAIENKLIVQETNTGMASISAGVGYVSFAIDHIPDVIAALTKIADKAQQI